jgi:hypothetical protein
MPTPLHKENWEEEFDEKFPSVETYSQRNGDYTEAPIPAIKAFIKSLRTQAKEEARREIVERLTLILNRCRTEKGLGLSIAKFLKDNPPSI